MKTKRFYLGLLPKKQIELDKQKLEKIRTRKARRIAKIILIPVMAYVGINALAGYGTRENLRSAMAYGEQTHEQSFLENAGDGLGHLTSKLCNFK